MRVCLCVCVCVCLCVSVSVCLCICMCVFLNLNIKTLRENIKGGEENRIKKVGDSGKEQTVMTGQGERWRDDGGIIEGWWEYR